MIQNKHIIRLSFLFLFVAIVAQIILYRYFMIKNIVLADTNGKDISIVEKYQINILQDNTYVKHILLNKPYNNLILDERFQQFMKESRDFFSHFDRTKIRLYNTSGHEIFSSNNLIISTPDQTSMTLFTKILYNLDCYFLEKYLNNDGLERALQKHSDYSILPCMTIHQPLNSNNTTGRSVVISYIPLLHDNQLIAVLELVSDVTDKWNKIGLLAEEVCITFFVMFCIFFIIIVYYTNYAQNIINQQSLANKLLEEAKDKAENENSATTKFLANVSHELCTPLNAIIGFSEMILSEAYGKMTNPQYLDYINDINNAGKNLLSVINDILDLSKAMAGTLQVENIRIDLNKIAISSIRLLQQKAESAGISLIEETPKEHTIIIADPKRLKQIFFNLLSNSIKFTPSGGSIKVEFTKNEKEKLVYVKIIDTGIGISDKDLPKALSNFGQVDNKFNRSYEGTGLGLPLTAKLVELVNGRFEIQSTEGKGTVATLIFQYYETKM